MSESEWRVLATYPSGFEADIAMAQLEAAKIPAVRDSNDAVGIFGPGFQGTTPQGFTVRVAADALEAARAVVTVRSGGVEDERSRQPKPKETFRIGNAPEKRSITTPMMIIGFVAGLITVLIILRLVF